MRIVTRPDFDGVVSAVLLIDAEAIDQPIFWTQPSDMQKGLVEIQPGDIIANLPYHEKCAKWFDHHYSNRMTTRFSGAFELAPSAARVIHTYYAAKFSRNWDELVFQADKIDTADLTIDEVRHPENYPYIILSMTVSGRDPEDETYWNHLVALLGGNPDINAVLADEMVVMRCAAENEKNLTYREVLRAHTQQMDHIAVTDFRSLDTAPDGNRFLVYSMFPDTVVQVKIRWVDDDHRQLVVSVGHSIFNRNCRVNVGHLLSRFEGGGHRGAGSCSFDAGKADTYIPRILDALLKNEELQEGADV
jgi:hypothetical protein